MTKTAKIRKPSIKTMPVDSGIEDALSSAYDVLIELRNEVGEVVDAMEDKPGLAATGRYQTLSETRDALSEAADAGVPDVPDCLSEVRCQYTENRERKLTRAGRRDNATAAMSAAIEAMAAWCDSDIAREKTGEEGDYETLADEVRELIDTVAEHLDTADGAEFPGTHG